MIAFPSMLVKPAEEAGMKVPTEDEADSFFDSKVTEEQKLEFREKYPHFFVYCNLQLGQPMPSAGVHWENAKVIAGFSEEDIKRVTWKEIEEKGFSVGYS